MEEVGPMRKLTQISLVLAAVLALTAGEAMARGGQRGGGQRGGGQGGGGQHGMSGRSSGGQFGSGTQAGSMQGQMMQNRYRRMQGSSNGQTGTMQQQRDATAAADATTTPHAAATTAGWIVRWPSCLHAVADDAAAFSRHAVRPGGTGRHSATDASARRLRQPCIRSRQAVGS